MPEKRILILWYTSRALPVVDKRLSIRQVISFGILVHDSPLVLNMRREWCLVDSGKSCLSKSYRTLQIRAARPRGCVALLRVKWRCHFKMCGNGNRLSNIE